ncbi:MAG: PIN domain-containing protein [Acidimicrobiia bacterium]
MLVLDSSGISRLAERSPRAVALLGALRSKGLWPPIVPSPVLIEALQANSAKDANTNRLLKACDVVEEIPRALARRAAELRTLARRGSAIDALLVAAAEPGGSVLTADTTDLRAIASHAHDVVVESA